MGLQETPQRLINIKSLKLWASANLPVGSPLREVMLIEDDFLSAQDFLVKLKGWLKLSDLESGRRQRI